MEDLSQVRKRRGITLETAAGHIDVSESTMEYLENNTSDIKLSDAVMLAELYDTNISEIRF
ncbi:hypothetical protein B2I21_07575 [Chryseobacterium mucoviscidosis]|nr:hypothetical protein B2I21_07575 [Chryseobacterium mucoviscidosis]